ncbi:putative ABC transporter ATP-binding protein [Janthinobacterium sp. HH103]|uniref:ABC transporter ATP-binding protein n=1 Tax=Janthinobacterium agaricidamnosum TaxID=55508 RepID=A0A3G2ECZ6_9BURK|nr:MULTISPECIES: ABC transporter ATP-binding protein [Janthinobacterium]AYM77782.1 ABC transporter ATP-binding protein [Janthinobacterium agaricidamnosum]OEZ69043.1 putative ABC transporter ATP-binding protein [Janthinobacterium sp. HH100]OEZ75304.1 putative ABC transporter ATP-binding protein [Janthinobacterium sp. HH103]OEZ81431.1 putative ABC transporter ATP-binding protein [Janthinobacterium sp. HH106]OFA02848.1 putative ABC transporter ATP-binding protein [Janthinobacterium sp. HH107]
MTTELSVPATTIPLTSLPEHWLAEVESKLSPGENVLSSVEVDLDARLRFTKGIIVVTEKRLLARSPGDTTWKSWSFRHGLRLTHHDHAGVGHLELFDDHGRLASWRFTLGQNLHAIRVLEQFVERLDSHLTGQPVLEAEQEVCPSCKAPLEPEQEECPICAKVLHTPPSTWTLFRLWRFAHPYRGQLALGFMLMLLSTAAHMIPPYLTAPLMDNVLIPYQNGKHIDPWLVVYYMSGLLGSALLAWLLGWGKTYVLALVSERMGADLRSATYEHLMKLSLEFFGGKRTGDLMARIGSGSDRICVFLSLHLLDFASDVLMIIMTGVILWSMNPWLAIMTLAPLPFIAWMIHLVRDRLRTGFEKIDRVWSEVTNVLADTIPGIRVVKAFAQEKREAARFRDANAHNLAVNDKLNKVWSLFSPTVSFLTEMGLLVIWCFGIWQLSRGEITVGVLTAFIAYSTRFYGRLDSMSRIVSVTQKSASAAKRIFDILDHVSSVPEPAQPVKLEKIEGRIDLREVGFRYGNRAVNRGITLNIKAGEMIGLVGHSGSGKSTLVNLICRFYDVSEGAILLDGVDIRSFAVSDYRRNIGLVLQEPFLFFGTIAENIAYGKPHATRQEIIAAARAAHAHEFILRLPQGYDSMVGERGQGLSGGERQRISIARALLIDPRILIMDEATSSVDSETEKEIQKALDNLVQGRTTIAIAHRLSTLHRADRLVVLDRGQVVEVGSHDELMAKEGAYFRLYEAQARNNELALDDKE